MSEIDGNFFVKNTDSNSGKVDEEPVNYVEMENEKIKNAKLFNLGNVDWESMMNNSQFEFPSAFGAEVAEPAGDSFSVVAPSPVKSVNKIGKTQNTTVKKYSEVKNNYSAESSFYPSTPTEIDEEVFSQALNNILPKDSLLRDKGKVFLDAANQCVFENNKSGIRSIQKVDKKVHADPFLIVGISMHESTKGTSSLAKSKNNIAGLGRINFKEESKNPKSNDGIDISIEYMAAYIERIKNVYKKETVKSIANSGLYCAAGNSHWKKRVPEFANDLRMEYNRLLAEKYGQ